MEIDDFREKTNWKVIVILTLILLTFAGVVFGIVMGKMAEHPWLREECDVNLVEEFRVGSVTSPKQAEGLVTHFIKAEMINETKFQYCSGYKIISGEDSYFLCHDGRLYRILNCWMVVQNESILPFLPSPDDMYGD